MALIWVAKSNMSMELDPYERAKGLAFAAKCAKLDPN